MLCPLMIEKYFLVVKVTLAVVTPWPAEDLLNIWMAALLLAHIVRRPNTSPGDLILIEKGEKIERAYCTREWTRQAAGSK